MDAPRSTTEQLFQEATPAGRPKALTSDATSEPSTSANAANIRSSAICHIAEHTAGVHAQTLACTRIEEAWITELVLWSQDVYIDKEQI